MLLQLSHMGHLANLTALTLFSATTWAIAAPEPAEGGGVAGSAVTTQMAATTYAAKLLTIDGTTTTTWADVTISFATTALGTWALGPTPGVGSIGLGSFSGTLLKGREATATTASA